MRKLRSIILDSGYPWIWLSIPCLLVAATPASGETERAVRAHFGTFNTEISIAVPEFHGLEPRLELAYGSGRRNGWIGVGWSLGGISMVERGRPNGGAPAYDNGDSFFLDGVELVECTSQGGTHCPRVQNYARISQNEDLDRWEVRGTNGNLALYEPIFETPRGTFRWMLTRVEDTFGNRVEYGYWCDGTLACYLDRITYNKTAIHFFSQLRPDKPTFAAGGVVGETHYRLESIVVSVDDDPARAYELIYTPSSGTGSSLLTEVRHYGRDVEVDFSGNILGGSQLPATKIQWRKPPADVPTRPLEFSKSLPGASTDANSFLNSYRNVYAGDWDGDGRTDILHLHPSTNPIYSWVGLSSGDGTFDFQRSLPGASVGTNSYIHTSYRNIITGDWNGDGKTDMLHLHPNADPQYSWTAISLGDGTFDFQKTLPGASTATNSYINTTHRNIYRGDWNGDGKTDILHLYPNPDPQYSWVGLSNGDGTFDFQRSLPGASTATNSWINGSQPIKIGDWNGDGRTDLAYINTSGDPQYSWVALSNGDGTFEFMRTLPGSDVATNSYRNSNLYIRTGDWNGDGKTDLIYLHPHSNPQYSWVALSNGDGTFDFRRSLPGAAIATQSYLSNREFLVGDWNGDGRSDLMHLEPNGNADRSWIAYSQGDGTFLFQASLPGASTTTSSYLGDNRYVLVGDWDGNGASDLVYLHPHADPQYSWTAMSRYEQSDLVEVFENGVGGRTSLQYTPSSRWQNSEMPNGLVVPTVEALTVEDGRGNSSTTSYSYEGGRYDFEERRFLGFRRVVHTVDSDGAYNETFFVQRVGSLSKPETTYLRNDEGKIYRYVHYDYNENTEPPYTSLLTGRWEYECNLSNDCQKVLTEFTYDEFSNIIAVAEHGNFDLSGDERLTVRGFFPNHENYLTGFPAYENLYEGLAVDDSALMRQTLYHYDGQSGFEQPPRSGKITRKLEWNDQTGAHLSTTYDYDSWGNMIRVVDPRGAATVTQWDSVFHTFPLRTCNALNHCASKVWDTILGLLLEEGDTNNATTSYQYDTFGRRSMVRYADGHEVTTEYLDWDDPNRRRVRTTRADGTGDGLWSEDYLDGLGRTYQQIAEGNIVRQTEYVGASEHIWRASLPFYDGETPQWTNYFRDGAGRLRLVGHPDGTTAETHYRNLAGGQPIAVFIDELGNEKVFWKDAYGRLNQIRETEGSQWHYTTYVHNARDEVIASFDSQGHASRIDWDSLGRKLRVEDVDSGVHEFTYDSGGLMLSRIDGRGRSIQYVYDLLGRPIRKSSSDGVVTWRYDQHENGIGRLASVSYPDGSEEHRWDARGREVESTRCVQGRCNRIARLYDGLGRLESVLYPDGEEVGYDYDDSGRLASIDGYLLVIDWNATGQPIHLAHGNGTQADFEYSDSRRWLLNASIRSFGSPLYESQYEYDLAGQVIYQRQSQIRLPGGPPPVDVIFADSFESGSMNEWFAGSVRKGSFGLSTKSQWVTNERSFDYDTLGRLIQIGGDETDTFSYDPLGNMTYSQSGGVHHFDDPNRPHAVTRVGGRTLTYDGSGNVVDDGQRRFQWNAENRLTSVEAGGITTTFRYDANGDRIEKSSSGGTVRYFGREVEEVDGRLVNYVWAGPILVARNSTDGREWFHADHLGSIRLVTNAAGQSVNSYEYDAFGALLRAGGSGTASRTFSGHVGDETGLVYMGARYYDPELCRFLSPDSVIPDPTNPQSLNRYAYVLNNPISNVDPMGHSPVVAVVASVVGAFFSNGASFVAVVALVGAGMSVAGELLDEPILSTIGGILLGFAEGFIKSGGDVLGGLLGAAVAAVNSPLLDIEPKVKEILNLVYEHYIASRTADGTGTVEPMPSPESSPETRQAMHHLRHDGETPETLQRLSNAMGAVAVDTTRIKRQDTGDSGPRSNGQSSPRATSRQRPWSSIGTPNDRRGSSWSAFQPTSPSMPVARALGLDPTKAPLGPRVGARLAALVSASPASSGRMFEDLRSQAGCAIQCGGGEGYRTFQLVRPLGTTYHGYHPVF